MTVNVRITRRHVLWALALTGRVVWPALLAGYAATRTWGNDPSDGYGAAGAFFLGLLGWFVLQVPAIAVALWYGRGPGRRWEAVACGLIATLAPLPAALLGGLLMG